MSEEVAEQKEKRLSRYANQIKSLNTGMTDRYRDYSGRGLWLFYLSLYPREIQRVAAMKRKRGTPAHVQSIEQGLFDAIFNNREYPFSITTVLNRQYVHTPITGTNHEQLINNIYNKLIEAAEKEILAQHKNLGKDALNLNIHLAANASSLSILKNDFQRYMASIFNQVAHGIGHEFNYDTLTNNSVIKHLAGRIADNPITAEYFTRLLKDEIIYELLKSGTMLHSNTINSFFETDALKDIIKVLTSNTITGKAVQQKIGLLSEDVVTEFLKHFSKIAMQQKNNAKEYVLKEITKTGSMTATMKYNPLDKYGKVSSKEIESNKYFMTPDIKIKISEGKLGQSTELGISLKTVSNLNKIIYKSSKGANESIKWHMIAHWQKVLQTFAVFGSFNPAVNARFKIFQILAGSIASLAIAGTKEHRALITIYLSKGQLVIKSLDVILKEMRNNSNMRMTMSQFRVSTKSSYLHNARKLASGRIQEGNKRISTVNPARISEELYQKYSQLKDLNFSYILATKTI